MGYIFMLEGYMRIFMGYTLSFMDLLSIYGLYWLVIGHNPFLMGFRSQKKSS